MFTESDKWLFSHLLEDIAVRALRRERVFRECTDMFAESDKWLFSHFRLPREVLIDLCNSLEPHLSHITNRSHPIPPYLQVLCTIGLLATGTFQREIGDRAGISQPSISRAIHKVVKAIVGLMTTYVKFPYDVAHQMVVKRGFCEISGIPNTIGAIDCTHVRMKAPSANAINYVNRKNYHSINVQIVCDASCNILNVVARWPGGTHDSFILQNSYLGQRLQVHYHDACCSQPNDPSRSALQPETCPCALSDRMCLDAAGGMLLYRPDKICQIVLACCVLHNIAMARGVPAPYGPHSQPEPVGDEPKQRFNHSFIEGRQIRCPLPSTHVFFPLLN
uniref:Putative nuclease HARBI1 n=1 Tax=Sinocyclocheilus grahami TaxID=75366 RepID=A0A672PWW7_SINGR